MAQLEFKCPCLTTSTGLHFHTGHSVIHTELCFGILHVNLFALCKSHPISQSCNSFLRYLVSRKEMVEPLFYDNSFGFRPNKYYED